MKKIRLLGHRRDETRKLMHSNSPEITSGELFVRHNGSCNRVVTSCTYSDFPTNIEVERQLQDVATTHRGD